MMVGGLLSSDLVMMMLWMVSEKDDGDERSIHFLLGRPTTKLCTGETIIRIWMQYHNRLKHKTKKPYLLILETLFFWYDVVVSCQVQYQGRALCLVLVLRCFYII